MYICYCPLRDPNWNKNIVLYCIVYVLPLEIHLSRAFRTEVIDLFTKISHFKIIGGVMQSITHVPLGQMITMFITCWKCYYTTENFKVPCTNLIVHGYESFGQRKCHFKSNMSSMTLYVNIFIYMYISA